MFCCDSQVCLAGKGIQDLLKDWKVVLSQMSITKVEGRLRIFAQIAHLISDEHPPKILKLI